MTYHVLARKWRPQTFSDMVGQTHVVKALTFALSHNQVHHAYLFTGTRGVGKTSIARIFAKSLNCQTHGVSANPCGSCESCREIKSGKFVDLIEVDAASRTGVEETRELIESVAYLPTKGRFKVYLIDEVHMFSKSSFNALLKTLEEPPEYVKFILATTDPEKLPITILSRCLQFNLKSLTQAQIRQHLANICQAESIAYDKEALALLAKAGDGSMRDTLSMTDQAIAYGQGKLSTIAVTEILGTIRPADIEAILFAVATNNPNQLSAALHRLDDYEVDARAFLIEIMKRLQAMAWAKEGIVEQLSPALLSAVAEIPKALLHLWYDIAEKALPNLAVAGDPREAVEMTLLRMLAFVPNDWLPRQRTLLEDTLESDNDLSDDSDTALDNKTANAQRGVNTDNPTPATAAKAVLKDDLKTDNKQNKSARLAEPVQASPVAAADNLAEAEANFSQQTNTEETPSDTPTLIDAAPVEKHQENNDQTQAAWHLSEESSNEPPPDQATIDALMQRGCDLPTRQRGESSSLQTDETDHPPWEAADKTPDPLPHVKAEAEQPLPHVKAETEQPLPHVGAEAEQPLPHVGAEAEQPLPHVGAEAEQPLPHVKAEAEQPLPHVKAEAEQPLPHVKAEAEQPLPHVEAEAEQPLPHVKTKTAPATLLSDWVSDFNWEEAIDLLGLSDYTRQFVSLGILRIETADNHLLATLDLPPKHEVMVTEDSLSELKAALEKHSKQSVKVKVNLTEITQATPAENRQQRQQQQEAALLTQFEQLPQVTQILAAFGGQIIEKTIKPTQ